MQNKLKFIVFSLLFLLPLTHLLAQDEFVNEQGVEEEIIEEVVDNNIENTLPIISELALNVSDKDIPWLELYNSENYEIDLTDLVISDDQGYEVVLSGKINPGSYLVVLIPNLSLDATSISLGESIVWSVNTEQEQGTSLIDNNGEISLTYFPTPGRPNILELKKLSCEENEEEEESNEEEVIETELETGNIVLNEIFANPEGDEAIYEFIELYNKDSKTINLDGWVISDNTKSFSLDGLSIQSFDYLVIKRSDSGIALNNGVETITLTDPFKMIIDSYSYSSTTEGLSWNTADEWYEALPSLGNDNNEIQFEEENEEEKTNETEQVEEENKETEEAPEELFLDQIIINELLPNPVGPDSAEWIELYNPTDNIIDLFGLVVQDASSSFTFQSQIIQPKNFYVLERSISGIALNNTNETLSLLVNDNVTDSFSYQSSTENISWARNENNEWLETEIITKGTVNQFNLEVEETDAEEDDNASQTVEQDKDVKAAQSMPRINLDQWESIENGKELYVIGTISLAPETFSKRQAILQSIINDQAYILELYFHKADWPELNIGDSVQIMGEKSSTQTGSRLLIRSSEDIVKLSAGSDPVINDDNLNLDSLVDNSLISLKGMIMEVQNKQILIDYNDTEVEIDLTKLESIEKTFEPNQLIFATGIFKRKNNKISLTPRSNNDLVIIENNNSDDTQIDDNQISITNEPTNQAKPSALYFALGTSATSLGFFVTKYKEQALAILTSAFDKIKKS